MRVVVVGCGLAGITTAYFLARAGAEVTVLDRAAAPARETSFANGSLLTPGLADPWNAPGVARQIVRGLGRADSPLFVHASQLFSIGTWGIRFLRNAAPARYQQSFLHNVRFARFSQQVMDCIRAESGVEFDYAAVGVVKLYEQPGALEHAVKIAHWLKQAGVTHELLSVAELVALEPALAAGQDRLVGAIRYPQDEVGDARRFCQELAAWLAGKGVTFQFSEQVLRFERAGRRVTGIVTPRGGVVADAYVIAAGSYSQLLAGELGVRLPVVPVKGYSLTLPVENGPRHPVVDDALHAAVVPLGCDRLRVAGTAEFAGFDPAVRPERIANLRNLLARLYPDLAVDGEAGQCWAGLRPMSPDGRPLLGSTRLENLFVNTGHGALGWTLAAGSGMVVADLVLGGEPAYDPTPFGLERFGRRK